MKQFELSRKSAGALITKFFVYNADGDIIGSISVPNEDAADLEKHWLGSAAQKPQAMTSATRGKRAIDALMEAERSAPVVAAPARKYENPAVAAMMAAAPRNRLSKQAILRG
jgi:hypothetical protein